MSLVAADGTPLVIVGAPGLEGGPHISSTNSAGLMDAVNEAVIFYGQIFTEDGGSHTIDTSGSSALGWRSAAVTFSDGGTTVKVGLAAMDLTSGPAARAVNSTNVVTFDVSKSMTGGGGGITANTWHEHVPDTGSKTVAHGDFIAFAIQMTARGGSDSATISTGSTVGGGITTRPGVTSYVSAAYNALGRVPNAVITFSDGKLGFFYGGYVATTGSTTQTWNSSSSPNEYGNFFQMPFPAKIYGLVANCSVGGNADFILYSTPLGTPAAEKTVSVDANAIGAAGQNAWLPLLFSSPYTSSANQPLGAIIKPTSVTNISGYYKTFNASSHQKSESLGSNGYAINRASGAFSVQNTNKDRFAIGLLVGAFEHGVQPNYVLGL